MSEATIERTEQAWNDATEARRGVAGSEPAATTGSDGVRIVSARELLGERRLVQIEHRGEIYTLRITKNDRLILTK